MFRIQTVHAFVAIDEEGEDGIIGMNLGTQGWMPFIAADEKRLDDLRPLALMIADMKGINVKLVRFTVREDLEICGPGMDWRPCGADD